MKFPLCTVRSDQSFEMGKSEERATSLAGDHWQYKISIAICFGLSVVAQITNVCLAENEFEDCQDLSTTSLFDSPTRSVGKYSFGRINYDNLASLIKNTFFSVAREVFSHEPLIICDVASSEMNRQSTTSTGICSTSTTASGSMSIYSTDDRFLRKHDYANNILHTSSELPNSILTDEMEATDYPNSLQF